MEEVENTVPAISPLFPTGDADFDLALPWALAGDQPDAVSKLLTGFDKGYRQQTLLGVTGSGKTATMAAVIQELKRPTLIFSHNKTLAAQLYGEFKEFFPNNAVEYFVSYYDYYQPEAYIARSDTYIEKDSSKNEDIDKLRLAATRALFERRDVIIVASVSCIYGLGSPADFGSLVLSLEVGAERRRDSVLRQLVDIQYNRNDTGLVRGSFRVRGDTLEISPAYEDSVIRVSFFGDTVEKITVSDPLTGAVREVVDKISIYPARHFVTPADKVQEALADIEAELETQVRYFKDSGKLIEAQRIEQRTRFDLEMLRETGTCNGVENYSRHLSRRPPGSRPWTLIDYFPADFLMLVDESHISLPQIKGMFKGDQARKTNLIDFGFRLPSALDNRPLTFAEFEQHLDRVAYVSATPSDYERVHSQQVVEQVIRPTGLLDPQIEVRPTNGQIDDLLNEVAVRISKGQRSLVTTLTKKMAEDLSDYLAEAGIKVQYLHSDVDTLERTDILRDLRLGIYDVLVGVNLLREGLDLPEVTLVAILDADKEGFLRSTSSLIQVIGRAARHVEGRVIMYADKMTDSMKNASGETDRRRALQEAYNTRHHINPTTIVKAIRDINARIRTEEAELKPDLKTTSEDDLRKMLTDMTAQMHAAAKGLRFEEAALLRDQVVEIKGLLLAADPTLPLDMSSQTYPKQPRKKQRLKL